jgi:hypothetical protein
VEQPIQIAGAVMILSAYIAAQRGVWSPRSLAYLWLNLVGSTVLAVLAGLDSDWGFLLLEGVWALVTAWSLLTRPGQRTESSTERISSP